MSKYVKDDAYCIADLDDFTLSTGIYDYLYNEWYEKFSASVTLKLSEHEQRKVAFYAGMKAAQQCLHPTAFGVCPHGVNLGNQACSACEPEKFGGG